MDGLGHAQITTQKYLHPHPDADADANAKNLTALNRIRNPDSDRDPTVPAE